MWVSPSLNTGRTRWLWSLTGYGHMLWLLQICLFGVQWHETTMEFVHNSTTYVWKTDYLSHSFVPLISVHVITTCILYFKSTVACNTLFSSLFLFYYQHNKWETGCQITAPRPICLQFYSHTIQYFSNYSFPMNIQHSSTSIISTFGGVSGYSTIVIVVKSRTTLLYSKPSLMQCSTWNTM